MYEHADISISLNPCLRLERGPIVPKSLIVLLVGLVFDAIKLVGVNYNAGVTVLRSNSKGDKVKPPLYHDPAFGKMFLKCSFVTQTNVLWTIINKIPTQDLRRIYWIFFWIIETWFFLNGFLVLHSPFSSLCCFILSGSRFAFNCWGSNHDLELWLGHIPSQNQGIFQADFSYWLHENHKNTCMHVRVRIIKILLCLWCACSSIKLNITSKYNISLVHFVNNS